jgi:anti-sigma regulatory factor (Ser/Thr protein kinase)
MTAPATPEILTLTLPSRLELLAVVDRVLLTLCERAGLDEEATSAFSMAVLEAATNAVQHGHQRDASRVFETIFECWPDRLEVEVRDHGSGFVVPTEVPDITSPEHLLDSRGRGLFIMRSCCDDVRIESGVNGTTCRLVKRRVAARAGTDA